MWFTILFFTICYIFRIKFYVKSFEFLSIRTIKLFNCMPSENLISIKIKHLHRLYYMIKNLCHTLFFFIPKDLKRILSSKIFFARHNLFLFTNKGLPCNLLIINRCDTKIQEVIAFGRSTHALHFNISSHLISKTFVLSIT